MLDVNVGCRGLMNRPPWSRRSRLLSQLVEAPLCIDSSTPEVIEAALRIYPGRALLNSISAERHKLERLLPRRQGMAPCLSSCPYPTPGAGDGGGTLPTGREVFGPGLWLSEMGYHCRRLVMTVSADQKAAMETLKVIEWCSRELGCGTIIGLSNVSLWPTWSVVGLMGLFSPWLLTGFNHGHCQPGGEMIMDLKAALDVLTQKTQ